LAHFLNVIKTFYGIVIGEQGSDITTAISAGIRHSLAPQDFFWHFAISQAWEGCTTVSSSFPFKFAKYFYLFFLLVLLVLVFLLSFCLYFSFTQKSIKISVVLLLLQYGISNY
jgi:hypothetical protein